MPRELPTSTLNEARSRITLRDLPVQKDLLAFSNAIIVVSYLWATARFTGKRVNARFASGRENQLHDRLDKQCLGHHYVVMQQRMTMGASIVARQATNL
jgi:hypothetical protein